MVLSTEHRSVFQKTWVMVIAAMAVLACMLFAVPFAFAVGTAFGALGNVMKTICLAIGAIFVGIGIIKVAIAHANEDGPATQKAAMMIATGIALIVLGPQVPGIISGLAGVVG